MGNYYTYFYRWCSFPTLVLRNHFVTDISTYSICGAVGIKFHSIFRIYFFPFPTFFPFSDSSFVGKLLIEIFV